MKTPAFLTLLAALAGTILPSNAQTTNDMQTVTAPDAKLVTIDESFSFTEGATCDANGNVFFTDQPNNRIMEWSTDQKMSTFMQPAGRANGQYFDAKGNLLACADEKTALWSITPDKKVTVLIDKYKGKLLNGPNDVWIRPDGGMYLTDPLYARPYWKRNPAMQQSGQHVYFLSPDSKTLRQVTNDLKVPNGIIGTPDGKTLYIGDLGFNQTFKFKIEKNGDLTHKEFFCPLG